MLTPQTILFCAANPSDTARLSLDAELNRIREGLRLGAQREYFTLQQVSSVRTDDLRRAVLEFQPTIVHFSGHGEGEAGLVFAGLDGRGHLVSTEALATFFRIFASKGLRCVILNACYSEVQAAAIARHIEYVVGMSAQISDDAAIEFSKAFYDTLVAGENIEMAYELGCNAIQLLGLPEELTPVLKTRAAQASQAAPTAPAHQEFSGIRVYLAEASDDLRKKRKEIKAYLEQQHIEVLPAQTYPGTDSVAWHPACQLELQQTSLFVQLLSEVNRTPQLSPLQQYRLAGGQGVKILQWRGADLDETEVEDAEYLSLLRNPQVMPIPFEEFKQETVRVLQQEALARKQAASRQAALTMRGSSDSRLVKRFVFVDTPPENLALAKQIEAWLKQHGLGVWLPDLEAASPDEFRQDLESNLRECHVLLLLFDPSLRAWLRDHLRMCDRVHAERKQPINHVAIYNPTGIALSLYEFNNFQVKWLCCPQPDHPQCLPVLQQWLSA